MEPVALSQVINSAVETSRPLIEDCRHNLSVAMPNSEVYVQADPLRLAQVFLNLLNNAAKYSDPGAGISVTVTTDLQQASVAVKDTGIGIDRDQMPKIFELFSQIDRSLEKSRGGLGIGLTLVKRLVALHGGRIEAHSEGSGKGSTFTVTLPMVEAPSVIEVAPRQDAANISGLRVLIVDDNRDSADTLTMMLKMRGNETRTAYDGEEAVSMAAEFLPDVILLDIGLPKLNGYDACQRIRHGRAKDAFIIAQTGWGQAEDRQKTHDAGFDFHIVKPIDIAQLFQLIQQVAERKQQA